MPKIMEEAFVGIALAIAPHVNRKAIMRRSPEARLAGRLFDADKIVKPLLGNAAEDFYLRTQKQWEWNSRYWEQRALLAADTDLETALKYARHAIAIESHPFPLTTLGKILLLIMEKNPGERQRAFDEAFDNLSSAISFEVRRSRITIHPYVTLFTGAARYVELGETLTPKQRGKLAGFITDANRHFTRDSQIQSALQRLNCNFP